MCAQLQTDPKPQEPVAPGEPVPPAALPAPKAAKLETLSALTAQGKALREEMFDYFQGAVAGVLPPGEIGFKTQQYATRLNRPMTELVGMLGDLENADIHTYRRAQKRLPAIMDSLRSVELDYSALRANEVNPKTGKRPGVNRADIEKLVETKQIPLHISVTAAEILADLAKLPKVKAGLDAEARAQLVGELPDRILQSFGTRGTYGDGSPLWEVKAGRASVYFKYDAAAGTMSYVEHDNNFDPKNPPKLHPITDPVQLKNADWEHEQKFIQGICDRLLKIPTMDVVAVKQESADAETRTKARSGAKGDVQSFLTLVAGAGLHHTDGVGYHFRIKGATHTFDIYQDADGKTQWKQSVPDGGKGFQLASVKPDGDHPEIKNFRALLDQIVLIETNETPAKFVSGLATRDERVAQSAAQGRVVLMQLAGAKEIKDNGTTLYQFTMGDTNVFFGQGKDGKWAWSEDQTKVNIPLDASSRYKANGRMGLPKRQFQAANEIATLLDGLNQAVDPPAKAK